MEHNERDLPYKIENLYQQDSKTKHVLHIKYNHKKRMFTMKQILPDDIHDALQINAITCNVMAKYVG